VQDSKLPAENKGIQIAFLCDSTYSPHLGLSTYCHIFCCRIAVGHLLPKARRKYNNSFRERLAPKPPSNNTNSAKLRTNLHEFSFCSFVGAVWRDGAGSGEDFLRTNCYICDG
jgi:hypothetical protein